MRLLPRIHCGFTTCISIHAPLTGCDGAKGNITRLIQISIHAPLTGCDSLTIFLIVLTGISIHAPLTGCDPPIIYHLILSKDFNPRTPYGMRHNNHIQLSFYWYFNPRTPYGMRHYQLYLSILLLYFNPRTPYGMRLCCNIKLIALIKFQSTHPLRDATRTCSYNPCVKPYFNPRTPYGMRQFRHVRYVYDIYFNPRTPYGMRQRNMYIQEDIRQISIHAPLTGCDEV